MLAVIFNRVVTSDVFFFFFDTLVVPFGTKIVHTLVTPKDEARMSEDASQHLCAMA